MKKLIVSLLLACAFTVQTKAVWITGVDASSPPSAFMVELYWFPEWDEMKTRDFWGDGSASPRWGVTAHVTSLPETPSGPPHRIWVFGGWENGLEFSFDVLFPTGARGFSDVAYVFRDAQPTAILPSRFTEYGARIVFGQLRSSVPDGGSSAALLGLGLVGVAAASRFSCSFMSRQ